MPEIEMPAGRYFSLSVSIPPGTGGQTRALLMRNRLLAQHAGIAPTLVTFDSPPNYPAIRASLTEQGQLVDPMSLLNIYEWYRDQTLKADEPTGHDLLEVEGFVAEDQQHPDGTVYRTAYLHKRSRLEAIYDYRRPDGSVYLRTPAGANAGTTPATPFVLVNADGVPVATWAQRGGLYRHWLRTLAGDADRVIIISDSRFALAQVVPMRDQRFHILHLMHNIHTVGKREWNSPLSHGYTSQLENIRHVDGLVTLTDRQRRDIAIRYGNTNNLFVVPNPVELPERPDPLPTRERQRFAIVTRLEPQKRLDHAIRAFELVLNQEPQAKLDIYGDGTLRIPLQELIGRLGLEGSVTLRGHDPRAREALWAATGFLMTSVYEGYPLATIESMSHGCPVVSYDIRYGPREQITPGVDGFLVPAGDLQGVADAVVQMIRDPGLATRMSSGAFDKADHHDYRVFLEDWRTVVATAIENKPFRTQLEAVDLTVHTLGYVRTGRLPRRLAKVRSSSAAFRSSRQIEFSGTLRVRGRGRKDTLASVMLTLEAVADGSGAVVAIPLRMHRTQRKFEVSTTFDLKTVFERMATTDHAVRLRLRLVWQNCCWEADLNRPEPMRPNYEISFTDAGDLHLHRGAGERESRA